MSNPNSPLLLSVLEIENHIVTLIATTCNLPKESIPLDEAIINLGIDSMIAARINMHVEQELKAELPFEDIANNASIKDIAQSIFQQKQTSTLENTALILNEKPLQPNNPLDDSNYFKEINALDRRFHDITALTQYKQVNLRKNMFKKAKIDLPFYKSFSSSSTDVLAFKNQQLINFSSYNYLGYNQDPRVNAAAFQAMEQYGTSAASSRIVAGEKDIHQQLESAIASLYGVDDALVFVSGYATNISVISHLMGKDDLIIHDSLAHNSIVMGAQYSAAKRLKFDHNNIAELECLLQENRLQYERVLIVIEGLYSMDGDTPPLAEIIALKKRYKCLLMIDEAHSMGVLGDTGMGIREQAGVTATDVDLWMGTLSKTFAGCGGYIAGCAALIDYLKFTAPGMIFSVGLAPPLAGASLQAIRLFDSIRKRLHPRNRPL